MIDFSAKLLAVQEILCGRPVLQMQSLDEGLKVAMVVRPFGAAGPYHLAGQGGQSVLAMIEGERQRANRDLDAERAAA